MLVSLGGVAAKIATAVGFQKGDDVVETLRDGGIFSDIIQEQWGHQLLKYNIISFWGALDNVSLGALMKCTHVLIIRLQTVPRESARFGIPGDREHVVVLNANHSSVCKFSPSQTDQDNFKLVRSNIRDLYKIVLKNSELSTLSLTISQERRVFADAGRF